MGSFLAYKRKRRQIRLVNFQEREIGFLMLAKQACFQDPALPDGNLAGGIAHRKWQGHANPLRSFYDVGIGHDVAARIHDYARANRVLANNERRLRSIFLAQRSVARHQNLHHRGRNLGSQGFQVGI